jgi:hypothetical protein
MGKAKGQRLDAVSVVLAARRSLASGSPSFDALDMVKYTVQRPRHLGKIQRVDEQGRVLDLPAAAAAHEAPKLLLIRPFLPRGLLLEGAEGSQVALRVNDLFHGGGTESADQLVLQVCDAHVETESFHVGAGEVRAEAGPLETALEVALLSGVTKARQPDVKPLRTEQIQEASDGLRTPYRQDGDALGVEIPTAALSERFERALVADPFNKHDRTREEGLSRLWAGDTRERANVVVRKPRRVAISTPPPVVRRRTIARGATRSSRFAERVATNVWLSSARGPRTGAL